MRKLLHRIPRLSIQIFLLILVCVILPMYLMFHYLCAEFERYMRDEISSRVIQGIAKSEEEIYQVLRNMAAISTALISNEYLLDVLMDDSSSYYNKTVAFDGAVANMTVNNLYTVDDIKISLFDLAGNVYSNWGINYNDYGFLLEQEWVQESIQQNGHIVWSMFSPGYVISAAVRPQESYISLARSVLSGGVDGQRIGTMIISIEQRQLRNALEKYMYNNTDRIYVCVDEGEILLRHDDSERDMREEIRGAFDRMEGSGGSLSVVDEMDGKRYLVSYYTISPSWTFDGQRLRVLHYTDYAGVAQQVAVFSRNIQTSMLLFLGLLLVPAWILSLRIVRPIRYLGQQMNLYTAGGTFGAIDISRRDEIGSLNRSFIAMYGHITNLFKTLETEHEVRERYHFESLRAQLNPHFLFNTLGSIRWMAIMRGANNMVQAIDALSGVLKYTMKRGGELVPLREELKSLRDYVFIQNMRYGNRYLLEEDIPPEAQKLYVVKFILQPIVENAILHGLKEMEKGGAIRIWTELGEDCFRLYVEDNGKGIPPDVLEKINQVGEPSVERRVTGIGIENVHQRIRTIYGAPYGLVIDSHPGSYTTVAYTLPLLHQGEEEGSDDTRYDC